MGVFSLSSLKQAAARAAVAGLATFAASDFFNSAFTLHGLYVAAGAAGLTALHSFVSTAGALKVSTPVA
jgi:hypothetical protein